MKELDDRANNLVPAPEEVSPVKTIYDKDGNPTEIGGYEVVQEAESAGGERVFMVVDENGNERYLTADGKELLLEKQGGKNAIQVETAGQVPVLTEAPVGKEVEQGKPQPKAEVVTEEGAKAEEVGSGGEGDVEILNTGYFGNGKDTSRDYRESNEGLSSNYGTTDLNSVRMYKDEKGNDVSEFFSLPKYKGYRIKVKEKSGKKLVSIHFESFNVGSDRSGGHGAILFEVPSTTNIDSKLIDKFIPVIEKYKTDNYSIQDGKLRPFKEFDDFTKPDFNLAKQKTAEQTPAQQVKQLRAEEQAELNDAIPNADQYKTDGKVDEDKLTKPEDKEVFNEIYDDYNELISPLLLEVALEDVNKARSVKYWMEPEFGAETKNYPQKGKPNSFIKTEQSGTIMGGGKWASDDIVAYDKDGKIVGSISIAKDGKDKGAFKIVVREDAKRQGWGKKILDEAEKQGIDIVGNIKKNSFTQSGRNLVRNWLEGKKEAKVEEVKTVPAIPKKKNSNVVKSLSEILSGKVFYEVVKDNDLTDEQSSELAKDLAESTNFPKKQFSKKDKIENDFDYDIEIDVKPIDNPIKQGKSKTESISQIVSKDELRPNMGGIFRDAENKKLVATDGMKMVVIDDSTISKTEIIDPKTNKIIDAKYPQYDVVIPKDNPIKRKVSVNEWLSQLNGLVETKKFFDKAIAVRIKIGEQEFVFDSKLLRDVFNVMAEQGVTNVELQLSQPNRALVIESNKGVMGLVMPFMLSEEYRGGLKTLHQSELTILEKNGMVQSEIDYLERRKKDRQNSLKDAEREFKKSKRKGDDFSVRYEKEKIAEIDVEIAEKKSELIDNPIQETQDLEIVKDNIDNGEITTEQATEFISKPTKRSRKTEQSIEDIESKANSEIENEVEESIKIANGLIAEKVTRTLAEIEKDQRQVLAKYHDALKEAGIYESAMKNKANPAQVEKIKNRFKDESDRLKAEKESVSPKSEPKLTKNEEAQKEVDTAVEDLLDFVRKSRGTATSFANVGDFSAKMAKVFIAYAKLGIVKLEDVIAKLRKDTGDDFVNENIDEIEDAWREANDRGKKTLSDFKNDAEKLLAQEEKERLRQEDLGLVTPKLEDYESKEPTSTSKDFESLAYQAIESDEFRDTLSNKERESGKTLTRAEKRYQVNPLMAAFELGESIVAKAKEEFGDTYVNDLLAYIAKNQNTLGVDKSSLILLTLENDLNRQQLSDPNNITLAKQERMVQNLAIAYQRSAARAVGYGRLRQIARVGYDVDEVTNQLFSSEQVEGRRKVVKAMESTADEINNEAELQEQETEGELIIEEPKVKRDAKQVRADIKEVIKQMRADLVKSARGAGGALSAIPFAQQVKDVTPHIIKLSKLFAELGGMKTKEIVAEIRKSIKGLAPDVDEAVITDILKGEKTTPKKAPKDRLEQAKDRVNKRIEELKQEIEDKRKELKVVNKVKSDAELDSLLEQEKELKKIANQYLTQESIDRINESKEKSIVTKLENEIANIDEQIANQQKLPKSSSSPVTSLEITLLKAQRKARIDVLNELDPNPKAFTKQALIDAGYSREITVTRKGGIKEKIQVLDWKKLAGNEMDVNAIKNIVEQALKDKGFTPAQISRMQDAFVNEFTELRASVVEKSIKELRKLNEPKESTKRKSSAKRLAELFDLGLFDQNSDEFDYLINKAIGLSDIGQEAFFEAKKLSESLKELFAMNSNEFFTKQFIREINLKISKLLNKVAFHEGNNWYRVTNVVSELMNLALRTLLQTLKQFFDNQISGRQERLIQDIGTMFQKGIDTKELKKLRLKYSSVIKSDITKNAGLYFGEVNSPFLTKSQIEGYINSRTDNQIYHALVSIALGKSYLEGADSMNKAASTEKFFTSMLLKAMTDKTNPNRMTPEAALQFVNEQLTGQKFADALIESAKIINQINTQAGKVVLANTKENIFRGAMDLVKANLLVGQALDANTIESAYDAAYKIAGYGLGHESNNFVTTLVNGFQSRIEEQIKKAVKEKEWGKAANLTVIATINRNILNPFVGGGTNWFVLGLQKSGIEPISPLYYMMQKMRNGIDLSTDSGKKKLEETLVEDYRRKTINKRLLIGGVSASLLTLGLFASGGDDEMEEWLKKNEWARGYQTVFVPQLTLFAMSVKNGKLGDWVENTFARYKKFENLPKIIRGLNAYNKSDGGEADKEKLYGVIGNVAGSFVNVPLLPVKFARDLGGVYRYIVDKPQEKPDFKNVGFANGFFNYGLIDYMGFRPDRTYMKNMEEYIPESDEKTIKFLRKNDLDINSNSDKAVLSNGIKKSLTEDEAQKYDNIWGKEAYRVIKEALVDNEDMDETQIKSLKKVAEFTATRKAQSELDVDNSSLQELEMDGVKYSLTEAQINKRKALIKEYIRDNRNSEKFKDRYREAIKKGNIIGSAESKYFMLMESAKSSATRKMNDIYENKTSALEVIPK
jgi:hypothetical protein